MTTKNSAVSVFALGGINEIGKNMYVIESYDDIVIIDCGGKFPDESLPGVDLIIPDITYLKENESKIRGLIVTHGHEDHIGGIPYFLKQLNVPVYATNLTLGLIEIKLKEHGILRDSKLFLIDEDSVLRLGTIRTTFFRTSHSIPDCLGITFQTPLGTIVHTGDFKFDWTPVDKQAADIHRMAAIGQEGVLLLLSESTNAERPGSSPSEKLIEEHLDETFRKATRKIFITTFASNVHRVQQIVDVCIRNNRKILLLGRSMVNVVRVAMQRGYLRIPEGMLLEESEVPTMSPEEVAILCTGGQGEPMAALSRLASSRFRKLEVHPEDTVIFSSSPIPGNETNVTRVVDNLLRLGANVIYGSGSKTGMHVSGHAYQEELKLMLTLMKPKYFVPIHGEYRMLHIHRELAQSVGVKRSNIFLLNNGDVVDIVDTNEVIQTRSVEAGDVFVDGSGIGDVGEIILRDRRVLAGDGMVVIVISLQKGLKKVLNGPDTLTRGFVYGPDSEELINLINQTVRTTVEKWDNNKNQRTLKKNIKNSVENLIYARTKKKPMILPILIEI